MKFLIKQLIREPRLWKCWLTCWRDQRYRLPPAAMREDLTLALELMDRADEAEADGLPCKADNLHSEACHLIASMSGRRVHPPMYARYGDQFKIRHYLFGYRARSSDRNAGKRPGIRDPD